MSQIQLKQIFRLESALGHWLSNVRREAIAQDYSLEQYYKALISGIRKHPLVRLQIWGSLKSLEHFGQGFELLMPEENETDEYILELLDWTDEMRKFLYEKDEQLQEFMNLQA